MDEPPKKRGGPGRGQGRKPISNEPSVIVQMRMSPPQHAKYKQLGGAKWVRKKIDEEKEE